MYVVGRGRQPLSGWHLVVEEGGVERPKASMGIARHINDALSQARTAIQNKSVDANKGSKYAAADFRGGSLEVYYGGEACTHQGRQWRSRVWKFHRAGIV